MRKSFARQTAAALAFLAVAGIAVLAPTPAQAAGHYKHFKTAIYIPVNVTQSLVDPRVFEHQFARAMSQVPFDKVYIEGYRDNHFASDAEIEAVKRQFQAKGIEVAGGVTLAAGGFNGQFMTFDYESSRDRDTCKRAMALMARHFDHVILDDFTFYTSKSDADIRAKGKRTWTDYRLATMRKVSKDLIIDPARAVNRNVKIVIKYPNWYEHFEGLGFDLAQQPEMFDGIYAGTETRDPVITDQLLQQYESYNIIRYYETLRKDGKNGGGWVDTYSIRYVDRYAEQLWDTMLAKAPEITLFNWHPMAETPGIDGGTRPWAEAATSFDWDTIARDWRKDHDSVPGWGRAAGAALGIADRVVGALGNPIGIAGYHPYQSSGEDFLHNYLGNIGMPIELYPTFPKDAPTILLAADAAHDPDIVAEIETALKAGRTVIVTSGLVEALGDRFYDIAEWTPTGNVALIGHYYNGFGAGNGTLLDDPDHPDATVLFPETRFYTNDSWPIIRGVARDKGFPIMLMDHYGKGTLLMLAVPENMGDLYALPQGVLAQIKRYAMADFPVRIDAPAKVALFAYDNRSFVVENYRDESAEVTISVAGAGPRLTAIAAEDAPAPVAGSDDPGRTDFAVTVPAHSFRAFNY